MATFNPAAIRSAIKTLLQTVTSVANVYDWNNPQVAGYPAIIFDISNDENSFLDSSHNLRVLTFDIYAIVEIPVDGIQDAKDKLDVITKDILAVLENKANLSLSGTVDWIEPSVGQRVQSQSPESNILYQQMRVKVNVASNIE